MVADDYTQALQVKRSALKIIAEFSLAGWNSALRIASPETIEKFVRGDVGSGGRSVVEEREALRESRRKRREKEGEEEII